MKKYLKIKVLKVSCLLIYAACLLSFFNTGCSKLPSPQKTGNYDSLITVWVDQVYSDPEKYCQPVKMRGKIVSIEQATSTLSFGCEDACIRVPVHYNGEFHEKPGVSALAIGKVVKKDGKYMFVAQKVETK